MSRITAPEVQSMVSHWLGCPPNGYFGSLYGSDIRAMLQTPQRSGLGNAFTAKLRRDVPVLAVVPNGRIDIGITDEAPDRRNIVIGVGSEFAIEAPVRAASPAQTLSSSLARSRRGGTVGFMSPTYSADEDAGDAQIVVVRGGGSSGIARVAYATVGGTAVPGRDYTPVSGFLTWLDGDTDPKIISVPLANDELLLTGTTVDLVLSNPTGATLGLQSTATLVISIDQTQYNGLLMLQQDLGTALYGELPQVAP